MLVNSNEILRQAEKEGYAVGAYNINNLEWTRYILEACNSDRCPVILAVTPKSVAYFGGYRVVYSVVKSLINDLNIKVPVVLHLDHASSFIECKEAIDFGFTSVMIDASKMSLEDNIDVTRKVVEYASSKNVSVEAEVGALNSEDSSDDSNKNYSSIEDCVSFVSATGVNSLAPSVGNMHGIYKEEAKIDFSLLGSICKSVKEPLVLHGASGLDDNKIKTAIFCGVSKININTDLQIVWAKSVRKYLKDNENEYDPRHIIKSGEKSLKDLIHYKNELFGSKNKAF